MTIKQVAEIKGVEAANELLRAGWKLLATTADKSTPIYVIGFPSNSGNPAQNQQSQTPQVQTQ